MEIKNADKKFLADFIEAYKGYPCLWRVESAEYKNKHKKNKAYKDLLKMYKTRDGNATIRTVKTKIDSMRGSFRKVVNKIRQSRRSGRLCDTYKPHLWYYKNLSFLLEQGHRKNDCTSSTSDIVLAEAKLAHSPLGEPEDPTATATLDRTPSTSAVQDVRSFHRESTDKCILKADDNICETRLEYVKEDKFDVMGKNIANKLREMPKEITIVTEKLINDIIFEAQMGNVTRRSKVMLHTTDIVPAPPPTPQSAAVQQQRRVAGQNVEHVRTSAARTFPIPFEENIKNEP